MIDESKNPTGRTNCRRRPNRISAPGLGVPASENQNDGDGLEKDRSQPNVSREAVGAHMIAVPKHGVGCEPERSRSEERSERNVVRNGEENQNTTPVGFEVLAVHSDCHQLEADQPLLGPMRPAMQQCAPLQAPKQGDKDRMMENALLRHRSILPGKVTCLTIMEDVVEEEAFGVCEKEEDAIWYEDESTNPMESAMEKPPTLVRTDAADECTSLEPPIIFDDEAYNRRLEAFAT